jgi:hypothetical protein
VSATSRPWWASDGAAAPGDDDVDPVDAHRAARRGASGPAGEWDVPVDDDGPPSAAAHGPDVCGICPFCVALRALGESRPQLVEHLSEAARHLSAALRSVLEDPPRPGGREERPPPRDAPFEHIDLD